MLSKRTIPPERNGAIAMHLRFVHLSAGALADQDFVAKNCGPGVPDGAFTNAADALKGRQFVAAAIHVHCVDEGAITLRDGGDAYGPFTPGEGWNPAQLPHHPSTVHSALKFAPKVAPKISVDANFTGIVELFGYLVPG